MCQLSLCSANCPFKLDGAQLSLSQLTVPLNLTAHNSLSLSRLPLREDVRLWSCIGP